MKLSPLTATGRIEGGYIQPYKYGADPFKSGVLMLTLTAWPTQLHCCFHKTPC